MRPCVLGNNEPKSIAEVFFYRRTSIRSTPDNALITLTDINSPLVFKLKELEKLGPKMKGIGEIFIMQRCVY